ncbi:MAG: response regulator [Leptospiraceae bacterium]|nr:response regulator [Leptospiraceae bacterium]
MRNSLNNNFKWFGKVIFLLSLLLTFNCTSKNEPNKILAQKGILDLSTWDFEKDGIVSLNGEWEFYWEKYLEPKDFRNQIVNSGFINVPHRWNNHEVNGKQIGANGFATFRLRLKLPKSESVKAFRLAIQNTAYSFWVNDSLLAMTGKFGTSKESMEPKYLPRTFEFYTKEDNLSIVMNVSNFHNRFGGVRTPIEFGLSRDIKVARERSIALDLFIFGSLFIIGLYYFAIYLLRRRDLSALYFAIYSLMFSVKSILEGERFLIQLFPDFPWEWDLKISYIITFMAPALFGTFLRSIFKKEFHKTVLRFVQIISVILIVITLFTQARIYSFLAVPHQIYLIPLGLYVFYVFCKAIRNKRVGAKILLAGFIVYFILAAINDSLYSSGIIQTFYMSAYALFLFVLSQGLVLAIRFSNAFGAVEKLTTDLSKTNKAYGRFIPYEFLKFLEKKDIKDVELGDQIQKQMTVFFSDIRSFTELSESMTPVENFNFINSYLKRINPIIRNNNGFIDKFIGDAVMAIFPNSPEDAVTAAIQIQLEIRKYNSHKHNNGYRPIQIGIGINTGSLMMGTVGDINRMDTTVIGDTVNLASRLESLTKQYFVPIIVSEFSVAKIKSIETFCLREIDSVRVRGKSAPINIYECYAIDTEERIKQKEDSSVYLFPGLIQYQLGNYEAAFKNFVKAHELCSDDPIPLLHINRCQDIISQMANQSLIEKENLNHKLKVLVVQENISIRVLLEKVLSKNNFETMVAEDGKDGYENVITSKPNAIIVDFLLSDMNGFDFIKKIQTEVVNSHYNPVFILLSDKESEEDLFNANLTGIRDVMVEPIDVKKILEVINKRLLERIS